MRSFGSALGWTRHATKPANELYPAFSPDGSWIAYRSLESGVSEIYVRSFPENGGKWLVSNNGGIYPIWSRNGRELFYVNAQQQIIVATYTTKGDTSIPDKPRLWSDKQLADTTTSQNADIAPDGKRFLVLAPADAADAQHEPYRFPRKFPRRTETQDAAEVDPLGAHSYGK